MICYVHRCIFDVYVCILDVYAMYMFTCLRICDHGPDLNTNALLQLDSQRSVTADSISQSWKLICVFEQLFKVDV